MVNGFPYLGKDDARPRPASLLLGEHVVLTLMQPHLDKGRNVTTDNFFTSLRLAKQLLARKTTLVGTMRKDKRELPHRPEESTPELYSSQLWRHEKAIHTMYQGKKDITVNVLSTQHNHVEITSVKKRPDTVAYYNVTKVGVDILDQMARLYSVKG